MMKPAIVVLAFNRPFALKRLLDSLNRADYGGTPTLVISLEGGANQEVVEIAEAFSSKKVNVRVISRAARLGLRDHVIACGDLADEYGSVIILEDDLLVDPYFYVYASEALSFYERHTCVAGIALYSHEYNEFAGLPFTPMGNGYDSFPMQLACSWGQCWTREQWFAFKRWYVERNQTDLEKMEYLPQAVKTWPESSWKKYFHGFMVDQKKWFIYPYQSYSTNCSDEGGTHIKTQSNQHQVALPSPLRPKPKLSFCPMGHREVVYDSFMEPCGDFVWRTIGLPEEDVEIDIQGVKPLSVLKKKTYAVTFREAKYKKRKYLFNFRPPELNLSAMEALGDEEPGNFWLCSTASFEENGRARNPVIRYNYYARMNLVRKDIVSALLRFLPRRLFTKILNVRS